MKRVTLCLLLIACCFTLVRAQVPGFTRGHQYCAARKMNLSPDKMRLKYSPNSPKHSFDVLKYKLSLDFMNNYSSPYSKAFPGSVILQFRIDTTLNAISLNAVNTSIGVDSVSLSGTSFVHEDDILTVNLDRQYLAGEITEVKIYYHHNNVADGAFYVSGGFLFTDCEPEGARKWFPCYDSPSDKAMVDITAKVPSNVRLGSNGRLQDSLVDMNSVTYHWISRDPVATYLVVLTSRVNYKLDIVEWTNPNTNEVIPIRFYYNPNENPSGVESIICDMTSFYSSEFGDHPFEKNGFATLNSQFSWGGMENQTLTSFCPNCWDEWLTAHEFAHQWFGDMITCATWADIFLNEGFATWTEAHWTEHTSGYQAYKTEIDGNANYYLSANPGWAISDPSWASSTPNTDELFNYAVTYMKGSCVVHQLRYVLGDSLFFAGIKSYATDTVNFKYKSATIPDFRDKMEAVTGQELDWFFDGWVYHANHPTYKNVYAIQQTGPESWRVTFTARQQQAALYYWQMPLEIKINFMDMTDTVIRVFNSYNSQIYTFDFDKEPANLVFDPNNNIVLKQGNTIVDVEEPESLSDKMACVHPNQFDEYTTLSYFLPEPSLVNVVLYDPVGRILFRQNRIQSDAGSHELRINGQGLASGVYFLKFSAGRQSRVMKVIRK